MTTVLKVDKKKHAFAILDQLDNMRNEKSRSNFKVIVDGNTIPAQRDILMAASGYFNAMLSHDTKENQRGEVEMKDVDFECVKICIDFIYGREISVPSEKYKDLMFVADMMQLKILCEGIEELMMENMNLKSFFKLKKISDLYECPLLRRQCSEFAEENFLAIRKEREFNEIDKRYLLTLIESENIGISELEKLEIILQWVKHKSSRKSDLANLLNGVDLDKIPIGRRRYFIENEQLISRNFEIYQLFSSSVMNSAKVPIDDPTQLQNNVLIFDTESDDLRIFNPRTNQVTETNLRTMEMQRGYSVAITNDHIYQLGEDKSVYRLKYCDKTATWERMSDMVDEHGQRPPAVVISGHIYVIGGGGRVSTSSVEKYDPNRNDWKRFCEKPRKSNASAVVALGGCIYNLGGEEGKNRINKEVMKLDVTKSEWTALASMNEERIFLAATAWKGNIIIAGGRNKKGEILSSFECYDVAFDQWTILPCMNAARESFTLVFADRQILALGGFNSDDASSSIETYDEQKEKWTTLQLPRDTNLDIYRAILVDSDN